MAHLNQPLQRTSLRHELSNPDKYLLEIKRISTVSHVSRLPGKRVNKQGTLTVDDAQRTTEYSETTWSIPGI
jgi:hypothetical protein